MADNYEAAIHGDSRGQHVKYFGRSPEGLHRDGYVIHEVFMTVNNANALRGLHFQVAPVQEKIVTCVAGELIANVVSLELGKNFGKLVQRVTLKSPENGGGGILHVPAYHALGYRSLVDESKVLYLAGADFNASGDIGIDPFDEELDLDWGLTTEGYRFTKQDAILSPRDQTLPTLDEYRKTLGKG